MRRALFLALLVAALLCPLGRAAAPPRAFDDPLPKGAIARLGHARMVGDYAFVALTPDGKLAYSGKWFDLATGKVVAAPVHIPEGAYLTRFFSDGSYLVHGSSDDQIFAPKSDTPRVRLPFNRGYNEFDAAGRFCLQIQEGDKESSGEVALVDLRHGDLEKGRRVLASPKDAPYGGRLTPSASHAVWLEATRDENRFRSPRFCVYDLKASKLRSVNLPEAVPFANVAISPDGKTVALHEGKSLYLFDTAAGKRTRTVNKVPGGTRFPCQFTPDGKEVAIHTRPGLLMVPVDPKKPARHFPVSLAAFLPDSRRLVAMGRALVISIHDLKTGKQLDHFSRFSAFDGVRMIGDHTAASWNETGLLVTWDVRTGRPLSETTLKPKAPFPEFREMRFSPDGRHVAAWTAKGDSLCVLAETASGKILREVSGPADKAIPAFFHPSRAEAAIHDPERTAYRGVDLKTGKWTRTLLPMGEGDVQLSPDARTMLVSSGNSVSLHESVSGKVRWSEPVDPEGGNLLHRAMLVGKGRRALVVRQRTVSVFDTLSGRLTASFPLHKDRPRSFPYGDCCAASADGRWLALVGDGSGVRYSSVVRLFDLASEDPSVAVFNAELPSPDPFVFSLALDRDGARLVTAYLDGTCLVWDLKQLVPPAPRKKQTDSWELLARADPAEAQPALAALGKEPARAVKLFASKLSPVVEVPAARIAGWVADLDSEEFDRRAAAERGLAAARDQAEDELRKVIGKPGSLEQVRRAERLLARIDPASDPDLLRQARVVEVLERLGTKEAVALLEKLAKGAPAARLTREAKESLARLTRSDDS